MPREQILATIDIGSSKIVTLIAEVSEEKVQIIGVSSVPSQGIKKGVVVDIDDAVEALTHGIDAAERMAGVTISRVWVTVNGTHISSVNSQGVVAITSPDGEIMPSDVERVVEAARAVSMPSTREIIHVVPRTYIIDSQEGIHDPVGMSGTRLQVETHLISGATTSMRNLVKCVQQVGLDVENLIFTGLASSESVLSETEKELGVVLVDIGGGTTDVVVIVDGSPVYSSVLKLGGKNITSDIAIGLRVSIEDAERIKQYISQGVMRVKDPTVGEKEDLSEQFDVSILAIENVATIDRSFLVDGVIGPRLEEIAEEVQQEIKKSGYDGMTPAGLVVCGGPALTQGLKEIFVKEIGLPVRVAVPEGVSGLVDELNSPAFAASVGAVLYAARSSTGGRTFMPGIPNVSLSGVKQSLQNVKSWFKGFIP
ncbi:cell division protein FtsA [candidate division WWE3 bacterium CG_4_9_14_3_um_filter_41_6]|uniref:Cell division protein FtsA n=1 Tax=candidate division WWE3 bacterium CG_4_10_14_0_2_um_filter_41_14 TaxID=1975072 RepID=A0A2M7THJ3_UNCKA|nr:MAG: cell division protein FtsA [candidate division WWE3 bacterium CG_4_10_14_0_2_um_filter_41_14]PJA39467.1 MAG: cell division protein FtsA [candidate division WWE3 bacterium CG_4_9_14_3_um_filter_41_6]